MTKLLSTADLVRLLQESDPEGTLVLQVRIVDADGDPVAGGELTRDDLDMSVRNKRQTADGDRDVLRLTLRLDE